MCFLSFMRPVHALCYEQYMFFAVQCQTYGKPNDLCGRKQSRIHRNCKPMISIRVFFLHIFQNIN